MVNLTLVFSLLFSFAVFASSTKQMSLSSKKSITCMDNESSYQFEFDYGLENLGQKQKKLSEALMFEEHLHAQIRLENEKYNKLTMTSVYGYGKESRKSLKTQISRQYVVTMDLVSSAEFLSQYIDWLQM